VKLNRKSGSLDGTESVDTAHTHTRTRTHARTYVRRWFFEVLSELGKEDLALMIQFITGTSKVPLEGFKALQGIGGPQKFQIHKVRACAGAVRAAAGWVGGQGEVCSHLARRPPAALQRDKPYSFSRSL